MTNNKYKLSLFTFFIITTVLLAPSVVSSVYADSGYVSLVAHAETISSSEIYVTWDAMPDGDLVDYTYKIFTYISLTNQFHVTYTSDTSFIDSGLIASTTYFYYIYIYLNDELVNDVAINVISDTTFAYGVDPPIPKSDPTPKTIPNTSENISIEPNKKSKSNTNKHLTKPTFGIDHKTYIQKITDGFSFNDESFDITDNFLTPFEQQTIRIGEINTFSAKVFAEKKLKVQEFLFGIPIVGEAHNAELGVEIHYDHSGEIEEIIVIQKTNVIDINSIQIEKIESKCRADSSDELCVTTQLQMIFLEPLQDSIMAIKAIDYKNRYIITYLNEGFDISGGSLNPMKTMMIIGTEKYEGLIKVTQIAKYSDVWVAEDGRAFEMNEYYTPKLINQLIQDKIDTRNNLDRYHSDFVNSWEMKS